KAEHTAADGVAAVAAAYDRGETDEFIEATVVGSDASHGIAPGDAVVFFNFRADRARQLTNALVEPDFGGFERCRTPAVSFASLMEYDATADVPYAFGLPLLSEGLSETVAAAGLR